MRTTILVSALAALAVAAPSDAQERRERVEREMENRDRRVHVLPGTRVLSAARAPRAALGLTTSTRFSRADTLGVLVSGVTEGGPAARAGIQEGARLQAIGGVSLRISADDAEDPLLGSIGSRRLTRELGKRNPGDEVELRVAQGNQTRTVRVRLADADSLFRSRASTIIAARRDAARSALAERSALGIQVGTTGSRRDTLGVFVMSVDDEGPAARAGIIEGTRIAAINGVDVRVAPADADDNAIATARLQRLIRELRNTKPGDEVELRVWQNGQYRTARVRTVPADSLRRGGSTYIIGDRFVLPRPGAVIPGRPRLPQGGDFGAFRIQLSPELHLDLEDLLDGAFRGARGALEGAARELDGIERRQRVH